MLLTDAQAGTEAALLAFFKALADPLRLQIAGRLAAGEHSVAALAAALDQRPAAIYHHLASLEHAGLVSACGGPGQSYRLRLDAMQALAGRLMGRAAREVPAAAAAGDFERKILREFLNADGTVRMLPASEQRYLVIVRYVLRAFEAGRRYSEKEVNTVIRRYFHDSATLRRTMVDRGWMARERDGRAYWLAAAEPEP